MSPPAPRVEWDSCDVRTLERRIEVKSSAYMQAWSQRRPSDIVFRGLKAKTWWPAEGYSTETGYNADAYVFALLTATDHSAYDALDTSGWQFWVLPVADLERRGSKSVSLATVRSLAGEPVQYEDLAVAVREALVGSTLSGEHPLIDGKHQEQRPGE